MVKKSFILITVLCLSFALPLSASALTIPSLYGDLTNGTQVDNLVNYACRYDSFDSCKYIVFRDSQNSYYIVWGDKDDFSITGNTVTASNIEYVRYYRESNNTAWKYVYIQDDTLSLSPDYLCTTNLIGVLGVISDTADSWQYRTDIRNFAIVVGCLFIFIGACISIRGK